MRVRLRCGGVGGDRVGGVVERREAVLVGGHEVQDALDALGLGADHDVHQHERRGPARVLTGQQQRRHPAERGADQDRRLVERVDDVEDVGDEGVQRVVAVGGPVALAVAAQVQRERGVAVVGEPLGGLRPRVPGLAAAVQQHDGGLIARVQVADQVDAGALEGGHRATARGSNTCTPGRSTPPSTSRCFWTFALDDLGSSSWISTYIGTMNFGRRSASHAW